MVNDFATVVHELGGNLEESRMCRMGELFSLLAMVTIPAGSKPTLLRRLNDRLESPTGLPTVIDCRLTSKWARPADAQLQRVTVIGQDRRGLLHQVAAVFAAHAIDILTVETELLRSEFSGTVHFHSTMVVDGRSVTMRPLRERLAQVEASMGDVEVRLQDGEAVSLGGFATGG
jgi:glycine cleavage system regulatory protein